ncbi:glutaminyl-peptide cyclotransferase [Pseudobacter ginsenosidimutans]|uniref:Glutamine cyclotransferase n=1 Tax=Pseudobacter ginsenosidimutans TaxID=661488 RepID=A0A4Q7MFR5_9BACT|nr:glutaminyl-peptide cyclotransferase [Pseudobacter ginsenosidimutans]QEC45394.1 glutaminyl-peptide cyclotransferase [Pseudobacter ginsenosidimutans]RZS66921.1 glutamine cyclotransferase [Pseudobacter ginsenosidimutans]
MMKKIVYSSLLITAIASSCNNNDTQSGSEGTNVEAGTPRLQYTVVNAYPHDTNSFTQGLTIYNGQLYESTGSPDPAIPNNGSWIGTVDITTGKADHKATLAREHFGEGMTILNDKAYYITWQSKTGFVYQLPDFKKIREFSYNSDGWGLTNNGTSLIMSDGTNRIYFYSPDSMKLQNIISVNDHNGPVPNINELEFINGFIYANQWETPYILKIDPASGKVVGQLDFTNLVNEARAAYPNADVLNGIAFDSTNGKIFITGKKWPKLYEIKLQ